MPDVSHVSFRGCIRDTTGIQNPQSWTIGLHRQSCEMSFDSQILPFTHPPLSDPSREGFTQGSRAKWETTPVMSVEQVPDNPPPPTPPRRGLLWLTESEDVI